MIQMCPFSLLGMNELHDDLTPMSAAKRKSDVDHVFLRFGKKR